MHLSIFFSLTLCLDSFKKRLRVILFTSSKNRINQNYGQTNIRRTFFWYLIDINNLVGFPFVRFYFSFYIFFIVYRFTFKYFFILLLTLSEISLYFSSNSPFFINKDYIYFHQNLFYMHLTLEALRIKV